MYEELCTVRTMSTSRLRAYDQNEVSIDEGELDFEYWAPRTHSLSTEKKYQAPGTRYSNHTTRPKKYIGAQHALQQLKPTRFTTVEANTPYSR